MTDETRDDYICIDCGQELGNEDCPTCAAEPSWEEYQEMQKQ